MAEYIEREVTLHRMRSFAADVIFRGCKEMVSPKDSCNPLEWTKGYEQGMKDSSVLIATQAAADVAPVAHAEWVDYHFVKVDCPKSGFPTVKCSVCEIAFCDLINNHHFMYHYCPNCGARMDGERKCDDA